jgi:E3 ubiquitin-protein ligase DOA10
MRLFLDQAVAYFLIGISTVGYAVMLFSATWLYCYGTHPLCSAGWMPRTEITAVYIAFITVLLYLTRLVIRSLQEESAQPRDIEL